MKKKISNKTAIIIIVCIVVIAILYFIFFVVDIVGYIKNYNYLQDAGQRADELHQEIEDMSTELNEHKEEHEQRVNEIYSSIDY